jgi:hypothetical protein
MLFPEMSTSPAAPSLLDAGSSSACLGTGRTEWVIHTATVATSAEFMTNVNPAVIYRIAEEATSSRETSRAGESQAEASASTTLEGWYRSRPGAFGLAY